MPAATTTAAIAALLRNPVLLAAGIVFLVISLLPGPAGSHLLMSEASPPGSESMLFIDEGQSSSTGLQLFINEVQSSNSETIADEDGDFEDWIELYNAGADTVWLHGYGLSDDASRPWRWVFPEGVYVKPHGFLLVWASGKDRRASGSPLHTNFSIRTEGEELLLSSFTVPTGQNSPIIDQLPPTPIPTDLSYGRYPDGSKNWRLFDTPTPGEPNTDSPFDGITAAPVFSLEPGFYPEDQMLSIRTDDPEAVIYFTTDGSVPTTTSQVYGTPISIGRRDHEPDVFALIRTGPQFWSPPPEPVFKGHVFRAIAVRDGKKQSEVVTGSWFIHPDGRNRYTFPVISIAADPDHFFDHETGIMVPGIHYDPDNFVFSGNYNQRGEEWERPANLSIFEYHEDPFAYLRAAGCNRHAHRERSFFHDTGESRNGVLSQNVGVRIHGGATRRYPQKSLRIYARSSYDRDSEITYPLFPGQCKAGADEPLDTYKRLVLRSSGDDWHHTMFKDAMIQSLYTDRKVDQMAYRPVVVFINGEYWGIHNLRERYDAWYVETNYGIHRDEVAMLDNNAVVNHGRPSDSTHYIDMRNYARDRDLSEPHHLSFVESRMDIENYLAYKTFKVYTANADWPHNNIRFWRKRTEGFQPDAPYGADGRWRWMIFDLDASFGFPYEGANAWWAQYDHNTLEWITGNGNPRVSEAWVNDLFNGLIENEMFRNRFISLLAGDLNTRYHPEFVTSRIAEFREVYRPEMNEHQMRYARSAGLTLSGWDSHIETMMDFARKRPGYLRKHLMNHFDLPDTVSLNLSVIGSRNGHIRVDDMAIHRSTPGIPHDHSQWSGIYFQGVPVRMTAVTEENARFIEWQDSSGDPFDFNEISVTGYADASDISFEWIPDGDLTITAVFENGEITTSDNQDGQEPGQVPGFATLSQNYPNPFNQKTIIPYSLPERSTVVIEIYTIDGRLVTNIMEGVREPGSHFARFDAAGMAAGLYLYVMRINQGSLQEQVVPSKKMLLLR